MDEGGGITAKEADMDTILSFLPHRYPFLLVDRIRDIEADESAVGIKNVTANEPHFTGHFPGRPVMPGVLVVEGMAQTVAAICNMAEGKGRIVYLVTIDNSRFRKPVVPGDRLEYHVRKTRRRGNIWKFHCEAMVEGQKVAEADIGAMLADDESDASAA